ncbi:MAG: hypothetical protein PHW82_07425 [Bacteroidales bacterium]|nr:hypothetical protein [Bacteroidales bacterium]
MMKKRVLVLMVLVNFVVLHAKSQCGDYQYHILESVSNLYDVSDNTYDSFIMMRSAFESEDYDVMKEYADSAKDYIGLLKSSAYNSRTSIDLAYNTAEMCYCLNGQKVTADISDSAGIIYDKSKEIHKLYKKCIKTSDKDIAKRYAFQIMQLLENIQSICDKASKDCVNAQEACY